MEPILRWAGGKRWLLPRIVKNLPTYKTYFEPFIGSGALFFALEPKSAVISDTNPELINCYRRIRDDCKTIIRILKRLSINKKAYYLVRDELYLKASSVYRAAYFIYLNKLCWNGLYRVNSQGKFNVPFGSFNKNIDIVNSDNLLKAQILLKRTRIYCSDFEGAVKKVKKGDLVYFDPPYITTHMNNGFIEYNSKLFHASDEHRLAKKAFDLATKGISVVVSNAAHPLIKQQYDGPFNKYEIERVSSIAGDPSKRTRFRELLITSFDFKMDWLTFNPN